MIKLIKATPTDESFIPMQYDLLVNDKEVSTTTFKVSPYSNIDWTYDADEELTDEEIEEIDDFMNSNI